MKLVGLAVLAMCAFQSWAQTTSPQELHRLPVSKPALLAHYGSDAREVAELRLPAGQGPFPVVVLLHGGCLLSRMENRSGTAPLATALTAMGYATWNVEYRSLDDRGGGWPGTYEDWAASLDYLRVVARTQPLATDKVVVLGHSAGGAGAMWLAARPKLPAGAELRGAAPLPVRGAVDVDGPIDLQPFAGPDEEICGEPIVTRFMGGTPAQQPARYAQVTPSEKLPLGVPQLLISSAVLLPQLARSYSDKALAQGDKVTTVVVRSQGHFDIIAPGSPAWREQVEPALAQFLQQALR